MMLHDDSIRLQHMLEYSLKAVAMINGISHEDFKKDEMRCLAVVRLLEIVGEAAARVSQPCREKYGNIPWPLIISLRNRLIHGYFSVDLDILWDIVEQDLPELIQILQKSAH